MTESRTYPDGIRAHVSRAVHASHDRLDCCAWLGTIPDMEIPGARSGATTPIIGPGDLVRALLYRSGIDPASTVTSGYVDMVLWGWGDVSNDLATRIGGRPIVPRGFMWPEIRGQRACWLCQLSFADSRDIVGDLPGDILLVFAHYESGLPISASSMYECVWVDTEGGWKVYEGNVVRSADCAAFDRRQFWGVLTRVDVSRLRGSAHRFTCIGDAGGSKDRRQFGPTRSAYRRVAQLSTVRLNRNTPYPYVNIADPVRPPDSLDEMRQRGFGVLPDAGMPDGVLEVWLGGDGDTVCRYIQ
jgi:hypothetical protein